MRSADLELFEVRHQLTNGRRSTTISLSARNNEAEGIIAIGVVTILLEHDPELEKMLGRRFTLSIDDSARAELQKGGGG